MLLHHHIRPRIADGGLLDGHRRAAQHGIHALGLRLAPREPDQNARLTAPRLEHDRKLLRGDERFGLGPVLRRRLLLTGEASRAHRFDHLVLVSAGGVDAIRAPRHQCVLQPLGIRQATIAAAQHADNLNIVRQILFDPRQLHASGWRDIGPHTLCSARVELEDLSSSGSRVEHAAFDASAL